MPLNGLQKFSLIDYPGKICCVAFFGFCNFRCPFCHNPSLVFDPESQGRIDPPEFFRFLEKRKGKLDGIVFSGGEPTLDPELPELAVKAKSMGYLIRVDTNGSNPAVLKMLYDLGALDSLGIDFKAPPARYREICGIAAQENVLDSIRFAAAQGIELEIRTTVHRALLKEKDLRIMREILKQEHITHWVLQQFHKAELLDDTLNEIPTYSGRELSDLAAALGPGVTVRGI